MRRHIVPISLLLLGALPAFAQQSTHYKQEEHVVNAGGSPRSGQVLSSTGFRITLSSLGDGLMSASGSSSFQVQGGFVAGHPAAGEILNLRFTDKTTLLWDPEPSVGSYNLYRGLLSNLPGLNFGTCEQENLLSPTTQDTTGGEGLAPGDGFFYLITAENSLLKEGPKGFLSLGGPRLGSTCP